MVQIVAIFDTIGAMSLLIAFFISLQNYKKTREISSYWLVLSAAIFLGFFWASSVALEWLGLYPEIIDEMQQAIIASSATAFAIAALITAASFVKPTS